MVDNVTTMVLKVDLECPCCYKKVKKILCKFPQIRNQVYDEKANTVTINVVCGNPEKIRDKLCCKGYKVIKSIEIKEPHKEPEKKKEPEKPNSNGKDDKPKSDPTPPPEKPNEEPKPDPPETPESFPNPPKTPEPVAVLINVYPPIYPGQTCCGPCYEGYGGGPCYHGFGVPPPPQPYHEGYYGYWYSQGSRGCHVSRCDYYFSEENPQSCSIM